RGKTLVLRMRAPGRYVGLGRSVTLGESTAVAIDRMRRLLPSFLLSALLALASLVLFILRRSERIWAAYAAFALTSGFLSFLLMRGPAFLWRWNMPWWEIGIITFSLLAAAMSWLVQALLGPGRRGLTRSLSHVALAVVAVVVVLSWLHVLRFDLLLLVLRAYFVVALAINIAATLGSASRADTDGKILGG